MYAMSSVVYIARPAPWDTTSPGGGGDSDHERGVLDAGIVAISSRTSSRLSRK